MRSLFFNVNVLRNFDFENIYLKFSYVLLIRKSYVSFVGSILDRYKVKLKWKIVSFI